MSGEVRIIETTYEAGSYVDGIRSPAFFQFRSRAETDDWARERMRGAEAEGKTIKVHLFDWTQRPDAKFSGLAVEECRWLKTDAGRTRVWSTVDGGPLIAEAVAPRQAPAGGRPSTTRTSLEVRVIKDGKPTPISETCATPNEAKESASYKARAAGFDEFHILDSEAEFADAAAEGIDGIYVVPVKTTAYATAV
jgi:hypothetical protein